MYTLFLRSRFPIALTLIASLAIAGCGGGSGKSKSSKSSASVSSSVISASAGSLISSSSQSSLTSSSSSSVVVKDASPDAPVFTPITNASIKEFHTSNAVVLQGFEIPVAIRVVGGTYSIDGGDFTGNDGEVAPGQSLVVKLQAPQKYSSADVEQISALTLYLGLGDDEVSSQFTVTTKADTTPPQAKMMFPPKYSYSYGDTTLVRLTFEDDLSDIGRVTYKVNDGEPVEIELTEENFEYKEDEGHWQLIHLFPVDAESVGKNKYTVKVEDGAGNPIAQEGEIDFYVTYQPAIKRTAPLSIHYGLIYEAETETVVFTHDSGGKVVNVIQYYLGDGSATSHLIFEDASRFAASVGRARLIKLMSEPDTYAIMTEFGAIKFNLPNGKILSYAEVNTSAIYSAPFKIASGDQENLYAVDLSKKEIHRIDNEFNFLEVFADVSHLGLKNPGTPYLQAIYYDEINNKLVFSRLDKSMVVDTNDLTHYKYLGEDESAYSWGVAMNPKQRKYVSTRAEWDAADKSYSIVVALFDIDTLQESVFPQPFYGEGRDDDGGRALVDHSPDTYFIVTGIDGLIAIDWETGYKTSFYQIH